MIVDSPVSASPATALSARERFSEASAAVWHHAGAESRRLRHFYIGVEHLFLGLACVKPDLLDKILCPCGWSARTASDAVIQTIGTGPDPDWDRIRVTPRARVVLALSDRLRADSGQERVEPLHLLQAILLEGQSIPVRLMLQHGIDPGAALGSLVHPTPAGERVFSDPPDCMMPTAHKLTHTPILNRLGRDLVALASAGSFDPLVGRERELELLLEVLCRRAKNNPVLLGEAGVGKTAIVEGLALRIADGRVPPSLRGMRLVQVSASRLIAGVGACDEAQVRQLLEEVRGVPNVTLFVDEMHTLASGAGTDAAALLKPPLARGEIRCIGATTTAEYRRFIEGEPALERRFQPILVDEPGKALTLQILRGLRERYEAHHGVTIPDEALHACIALSTQYLRDRQQPDKAIDLMDQSAARVAIRASGAAVERPTFSEGEEGACLLPHVVTRGDVAGVVRDLIGIDVPSGAGDDPARMKDLEHFLGAQVLGQEEAVAAVAQVIRVAKRELDLRPFRPDGVLLLAGPGGVGKTSLARAVCRFLHGEDEEALVRLDMADYTEPHSLARLVGPPPGYVGYEEEGQLTGRVRTRPDCVLLLDDIDRAHPAVRALFLQVFDEGRLTDSRGRCVHFDHTTIILTTSLGAGAEGTAVGFRREEAAEKDQRLISILNEELTTDFVSRLDRVVPLRPLRPETIVKIAEGMLRQLAERLAGENKTLVIGAGVPEAIASYRFNARQGARHLARGVEDLVIEPLSTLAYRPEWGESPGVTLTATDGVIQVDLLPCSASV